MPAIPDLSAYLERLPEGRRDVFDRMAAEVAAVPVPESNGSFVFLAGQTDHPEYDDAEAVFWRAVEQLHLREARTDGELPLVYWGFHSIDLLGRRQSNGVLVTDRTVYLDDVGRDTARFEVETLDAAAIGLVGDALDVDGARIDLAQVASLLGDTSAVDAAAYLSAVVAVVKSAAEVEAPAVETETVEQLILSSRLSSDFLLPSRPKDAKGLAKLASKWKLPADEPLLVSLSSATFAGVYGIAVTHRAVYSRDLMEDVHRTPLERADGFTWEPEAKGFRIAADHLAPSLPAITDENRAYVSTLMQSVFRAAARAS
ncbi:hypothetical protein ACFXP7_11450 [Microbacterium sp. P06]|uniref:hypothetical protein n=1 Tax=unclassified Microbacterium TaxID=2609290 RepID=UPI003744FE25